MRRYLEAPDWKKTIVRKSPLGGRPNKQLPRKAYLCICRGDPHLACSRALISRFEILISTFLSIKPRASHGCLQALMSRRARSLTKIIARSIRPG